MPKISMLAALLAFAPLAAFVHGTSPVAVHGGQVVEDSAEHWVELVMKGDQMTAYVFDEDKNPVPSAQLTGKATVLAGGKSQQLVLAPAEANSLTGKLDPAATGKVTAVLSLTVGGKPAQARFAAVQQ